MTMNPDLLSAAERIQYEGSTILISARRCRAFRCSMEGTQRRDGQYCGASMMGQEQSQ